jgi:hypothetical protein
LLHTNDHALTVDVGGLQSYTLDAALLERLGNKDVQLDLFRDYASNVGFTRSRYLADRNFTQ